MNSDPSRNKHLTTYLILTRISAHVRVLRAHSHPPGYSNIFIWSQQTHGSVPLMLTDMKKKPGQIGNDLAGDVAGEVASDEAGDMVGVVAACSSLNVYLFT